MRTVFPHELCAALGLDPNRVCEITIRAKAGSVVTADVQMFVSPEQVSALRKFVLCATGGEVAAPKDGGGHA